MPKIKKEDIAPGLALFLDPADLLYENLSKTICAVPSSELSGLPLASQSPASTSHYFLCLENYESKSCWLSLSSTSDKATGKYGDSIPSANKKGDDHWTTGPSYYDVVHFWIMHVGNVPYWANKHSRNMKVLNAGPTFTYRFWPSPESWPSVKVWGT